jgi:transposase
MLRMDQVHVVRHKVLVEGRTQRAVARELGLSRTTVGKYVDQAAPVRKAEAGPRPRPVWDKVSGRVQALLTESAQWTGGGGGSMAESWRDDGGNGDGADTSAGSRLAE